MKLWLISQDENKGYDTFGSAVVAAETEEEARNTHPSPHTDGGSGVPDPCWGWTTPDKVKVKYLGEAAPDVSGRICASFNAG